MGLRRAMLLLLVAATAARRLSPSPVAPASKERSGKKKVLMLISDTGGGHRASAHALEAAMLKEMDMEAAARAEAKVQPLPSRPVALYWAAPHRTTVSAAARAASMAPESPRTFAPLTSSPSSPATSRSADRACAPAWRVLR